MITTIRCYGDKTLKLDALTVILNPRVVSKFLPIQAWNEQKTHHEYEMRGQNINVKKITNMNIKGGGGRGLPEILMCFRTGKFYAILTLKEKNFTYLSVRV